VDPDAELDAILEQVEAAGLIERYVDEEGWPTLRLTPAGVRVGRQLAMLGEDGQDALMAALLGEGDWLTPIPDHRPAQRAPAVGVVDPPGGPTVDGLPGPWRCAGRRPTLLP
jgi:hypothetical protein